MTDDDDLIEAMARAMFQPDQINRLDIAKDMLAVARPIIEAPLRAENEKLRAALNGCVRYFAMNKITGPVVVEARTAAAALKETGDE